MAIVGISFENGLQIDSSTSCTEVSPSTPSLDQVYEIFWSSSPDMGSALIPFATTDDDEVQISFFDAGPYNYVTFLLGNPLYEIFPNGKYFYIKPSGGTMDGAELYQVNEDHFIPLSSYFGPAPSGDEVAESFGTHTPYWVIPGCMDQDACNSDGNQTYPCGVCGFDSNDC